MMQTTAHDFRPVYTAKNLARRTPWGWKATCACGWADKPPYGTQKQALHAYYRHL